MTTAARARTRSASVAAARTPATTAPATTAAATPQAAEDLVAPTRSHVDALDARGAAVDRLLSAAAGLAESIRVTEQLAQQRADILTRRSTLLGPAREAGFRGPVISLAEAGRRTGRHPEVLRRWCLEGRIEGVRVGRTWGITPQTLATLLAHSGRSRPRLPTSGSA